MKQESKKLNNDAFRELNEDLAGFNDAIELCLFKLKVSKVKTPRKVKEALKMLLKKRLFNRKPIIIYLESSRCSMVNARISFLRA
ncbi:MAG: hypothetical protein ACXQTI_01035 [Candidatus Nezhaarchaeales archaeon]